MVRLTAPLPDTLRPLTPWPADRDLSADEWNRYFDAARAVQEAEPETVESALLELLDEASGGENERRLFLLLRIVFDLPSDAPADQRHTFKGWVNWPEPSAAGTLDLGWPVSWEGGRPALASPFAGSQGPRYGAVEEYRDLRERYPFRALSP